MRLLPVYDERGRVVGYVRQSRIIGIGTPDGVFRPGMVLRVADYQSPGSTAFEVLDDPEPGR